MRFIDNAPTLSNLVNGQRLRGAADMAMLVSMLRAASLYESVEAQF